jgi:protein-L-isoaspartate(D-aspartate) O-methyltransferase
MTDLDAQRRFLAEEIETTANLTSAAVVNALASVPRERFLPAGPWTIRSEVDLRAPDRTTVDADPRRVYHNVAVAIDAARQLFNGAPSLLATAIEALAVQPGARVMHLGTGTGYYTAILAHCAGPTGRVLGFEIDAALAASSRENLASMRSVEIRHGDGAGPLDEAFDAILINAGVTHPLAWWLDALAPGGRMVLPLTATMPAMGPIGKGLLLVVSRADDPNVLAARVLTFVAIYSALGIRDDSINAALGQAMMKSPVPNIRALRRDAHERTGTCWLHAQACCVSVE